MKYVFSTILSLPLIMMAMKIYYNRYYAEVIEQHQKEFFICIFQAVSRVKGSIFYILQRLAKSVNDCLSSVSWYMHSLSL